MHQHRKEQPLATREQNERKFPDWVELPDGGRRSRSSLLRLSGPIGVHCSCWSYPTGRV